MVKSLDLGVLLTGFIGLEPVIDLYSNTPNIIQDVPYNWHTGGGKSGSYFGEKFYALTPDLLLRASR